MKAKQQLRQPRSKPQARTAPSMDKVLEACAEISALGLEPPVLRSYLTTSVQRILAATAVDLLMRNGDGYVPTPIPAADENREEKQALLGHAQSFAAKAIEQKKIVDFSFSYRAEQGAVIYHGLALPLITVQSIAVLLAIRKSAFSPGEIMALTTLGNVARLALENAELAGRNAAQKQDMDRFLEISSE